jgi:hypothetical protein
MATVIARMSEVSSPAAMATPYDSRTRTIFGDGGDRLAVALDLVLVIEDVSKCLHVGAVFDVYGDLVPDAQFALRDPGYLASRGVLSHKALPEAKRLAVDLVPRSARRGCTRLCPRDLGEARERQSGRADSNRRPPAPKAGALTRLRYAPRLPQNGEFLKSRGGESIKR